MAEIERIVRLLENESVRVRTAAAVVLGELRTKNPKAVKLLLAMATSEDPALQIPALEALGRIGAKKALPELLPLLARGSQAVRRAAAHAVAGVGPSAVPQIRARMEEADSDERRYLSDILAELGGKDAFSSLLESFLTEDEDEARRAAIVARQTLREASAKERKSYLAQARRFLGSKRASESPAAMAAAVKLIGYLEDPSTVTSLVSYATGKRQPVPVRQEALIALRFALGRKKDVGSLATKILEVVETAPPEVARIARDTLAFVNIPSSMAKRLARLASHPDESIGLFAIERLGALKGETTVNALLEVIEEADTNRAKTAAEALAERPKAAAGLAKVLIAIEDPDRAWLVARTLRPHAAKVDTRTRNRLLKLAVDRLGKGEPAWEAPLDVVTRADPAAAAASLRALAGKLKRSRKLREAARVMGLLERTGEATDEDRYLQASLELRTSRRDIRPNARSRDPALEHLEALARSGYGVAGALKKDRGMTLEDLFYAGFHFVEEGHPLGEELLEAVVEKGGRKKIARAAKNKLKLAER